MAKPFEGLIGDSSELRVIQFLLPLKGLDFNISELAKETDISRQTIAGVVKKLVKYGILQKTSKHGNATYYAINGDSAFTKTFETLNNCIIEQMLGDEELDRIAAYWKEHAPPAPTSFPSERPKAVSSIQDDWELWGMPKPKIEWPEELPILVTERPAGLWPAGSGMMPDMT